MVNTEKPLAKQEQKKTAAVAKSKENKQKLVVPKQKKEEKKVAGPKKEEAKKEPKKEAKKKVEEKPKPKKTEAIVRAYNLPLSTKTSSAICKFIKFKKIQEAIDDLEQVVVLKSAVPMKGEIPHRKGKMMSGRYPQKAAQRFIVLLKSLSANANVNELENPIIVEAIANIGARPYGRFGTIRRKRSHIKIKVKERKVKKKK